MSQETISQETQSKDSILPEAFQETEEANQALNNQLAKVVAELEKARADLLYVKAEADNIRRRSLEDVEKARKFAIERFARELLGVNDALEMALADPSGNFETLKTGVELTQKSLVAVFDKLGVQEIPLAAGDKLDSNLHQAISAIADDSEVNTVLKVMQKGYQLSGRLLRPAMVTVSAGK